MRPPLPQETREPSAGLTVEPGADRSSCAPTAAQAGRLVEDAMDSAAMNALTRSAAATLGRRGGAAGTGKAKTRSREQYQEMARRSALARRTRRNALRVSMGMAPLKAGE